MQWWVLLCSHIMMCVQWRFLASFGVSLLTARVICHVQGEVLHWRNLAWEWMGKIFWEGVTQTLYIGFTWDAAYICSWPWYKGLLLPCHENKHINQLMYFCNHLTWQEICICYCTKLFCTFDWTSQRFGNYLWKDTCISFELGIHSIGKTVWLLNYEDFIKTSITLLSWWL